VSRNAGKVGNAGKAGKADKAGKVDKAAKIHASSNSAQTIPSNADRTAAVNVTKEGEKEGEKDKAKDKTFAHV